MKVIIVGAGAAGITAAHVLSEKGIEYEILEASSVCGGRVKKIDDFADFPIDLGAEWVHKAIRARPPLADALFKGRNKEFEIFRFVPKTLAQYKNGKLRKRNWFRAVLYLIQDFKFKKSTWFDFLNSHITEDIKNRIIYNTPVTKIDYSDSRVKLTTESDDVFEADKVLVTVPIKILQDGDITFAPGIPEEQLAEINKEKVGNGIKIFMEFSERFYPDIFEFGSFGNPLEDDHSYYDATIGKNSSKNILALFAHGKRATKYTSLEDDDEIVKYVLAELDEIFDGKASKCYQKSVVQNWSKEPYIRGSYSERKGNAAKMSAPLDNKVFFAGEAMNNKGRTIAVHGAIESSYLALEEMLESSVE